MIENINYTPKYDPSKIKEINNSTGGILAKTVPLPKNLNEESDKIFLASLNERESELNKIYEEIRKMKNSEGLLEEVL
jgi:hypothetical protein